MFQPCSDNKVITSSLDVVEPDVSGRTFWATLNQVRSAYLLSLVYFQFTFSQTHTQSYRITLFQCDTTHSTLFYPQSHWLAFSLPSCRIMQSQLFLLFINSPTVRSELLMRRNFLYKGIDNWEWHSKTSQSAKLMTPGLLNPFFALITLDIFMREK